MAASNLSLQLAELVAREYSFLRELDNDAASGKPAGPDSWSPKEELGHLIDSATNNHIRFTKATFENPSRGPGYDQEAWVKAHGYHELPWRIILDFWFSYNTFLVELIARIPASSLSTPCYVGEAEPVTLACLIEDYCLHMQHHIDHLLKRPEITEYPRKTAV